MNELIPSLEGLEKLEHWDKEYVFVKMIGDNFKNYNLRRRFIVLEGVDGSGKTTLGYNLVQFFRDNKQKVTFVRQPGSTLIGERVRQIMKDEGSCLNSRTRHLLIEAARVDLLSSLEEIRKKDPDIWIICDRHIDSSWAYQGTEAVPRAQIALTQEGFSDMIKPDVTIYLDIEPEIAQARVRASRDPDLRDNYDNADLSFYEGCRERYHERIANNRSHYLVVDGALNKERVLQETLIGLGLKPNLFK